MGRCRPNNQTRPHYTRKGKQPQNSTAKQQTIGYVTKTQTKRKPHLQDDSTETFPKWIPATT